MTDPLIDPLQRKQQLRTEASARRRAQAGKDRLSREICGKLAALPEYLAAATVLFYVGVRDEVRTRPFLETACGAKRIVVPYCVGPRLELFHIESLAELDVGGFGLWEPKAELRPRADRRVAVAQLDLIVVPGVAFDGRGGRLGHGQGYYDRLLRQTGPDTPTVAVAFQCQLFAEVPMLPHDVFMRKILTETAVYPPAPPTPG
ncbi:MAG: 5-formyltetrahydrofolate cyclo-ligase [Pirellulales bacterium]|nr:5-formyltetrahydrofolate cyclo-ligase [Pirellulales bacterium]